MSTNYREIKKILYRLKREKGQQGTIIQVTKGTTNYRTGAKDVAKVLTTVKRMIFLPYMDITKFSYPLTYIASNKNFTYGGFYDAQQRTVIIDIKDYAGELTPQHRILDGTKEYELTHITMTEDDSGYIAIMHRVANSVLTTEGSIFTETGEGIFTESGEPIYTELG